MDDKFFKSDLEKEIWIAVYVRYESGGATTEMRMKNATALVLDLREQSEKILAFGKWVKVAGEAAGLSEPGDAASPFKSDIERKIWVSAFARPEPGNSGHTTKDRAKRAWELVLEFRSPQKDEKLEWTKALAEITGG